MPNTKGNSYTAEFRRNRKIILDGGPPCHWCGSPADQADHLVPRALGGDDTLENLVPACANCNARRGAQLGNKLNPRKGQPRTQKPCKTQVFRSADAHPGRSPSESLSQDSDTPIGHDLPRLRAIRPDTVGSFAGEAAALYQELTGVELMAWQRLALEGQLAYLDDGKLAHRLSLVSVARQNGKSVALGALIAWWLLRRPLTHGPQLVVSTAHKYDVAKMIYRVLAPLLIDKYGATGTWSHGREELRMPDGSRWQLVAAKPMGGHGLSPDLVVVDELWSVSDEVIDQALLPSQRARPDPLFSMWSTAGTEESKAMQRWRDQGIRAIDQPSQLHFAEWSPPAGSSEHDPRTWAYANPALGTTIQPEQLLMELDAPNRAAFLRASLNMWVSAEEAWLPPGTWPALQVEQPELRGGGIFLETRTGESRYFLLRAVKEPEGVYVRFHGERRSLRETWAEIGDMLDADRDLTAYVGAGLESSIPLAQQKRVQLVGRREMLAGTRFTRSMIVEGRVHHCGSAVLGDHVSRAVAAEMGGGYTLSTKLSPGPIELARCLVWAVAQLGREEAKRARPAVVVASRRTR